ncbi:hypothetical protein F443_21680 [Phytophthora nicotianae P1569]|uniref:Uncharacterized protein n=1 Tax=Phytophthora nicotianae P1569 TaxID=1317065 RepID=V9DYG1_PHYNI|nr:hypothetical protein F443_21680 [Phytophthora nicotianae P1569]
MLARSVSVDVGLRILDIFILQQNLKVGSNYGRNPPMHHADILTLAQTATCAVELLRSHRSWTSVDTLALEANLQRSRQHNDSIKELLTKQIVFTETGKLSKADFFNSLCLAELDYEAAAGFLRKISSNGNQRLKLRRRSFATLAAKINCLATKTSPATNDPLRLFRFSSPNPCAETTPRELELLSQLFSALRQLNGIRKRRQVFVMVYDFATCVCAGIYPKTPAALITKWNNMKQQSNAAKLKIKLKLSPGIMAPLHYTPVQCKYYPNI